MECGQVYWGMGRLELDFSIGWCSTKGWPQDETRNASKGGNLPLFRLSAWDPQSFPGARLSLIEFFRTIRMVGVFQYPRNRSIYHGQEPDAAVYYWLGDVTWLSKRTMKRIWTIPACHGSHWESWHFFRGVFLVGVVFSSLMVGPGLRAISPWKRGFEHLFALVVHSICEVWLVWLYSSVFL